MPVVRGKSGVSVLFRGAGCAAERFFVGNSGAELSVSGRRYGAGQHRGACLCVAACQRQAGRSRTLCLGSSDGLRRIDADFVCGGAGAVRCPAAPDGVCRPELCRALPAHRHARAPVLWDYLYITGRFADKWPFSHGRSGQSARRGVDSGLPCAGREAFRRDGACGHGRGRAGAANRDAGAARASARPALAAPTLLGKRVMSMPPRDMSKSVPTGISYSILLPVCSFSFSS